MLSTPVKSMPPTAEAASEMGRCNCRQRGDVTVAQHFDRFHIVAHMNAAVDQVRRRENKQLRLDGDDRLVGSKHLWLYGGGLPADRYDLADRVAFVELRESNL